MAKERRTGSRRNPSRDIQPADFLHFVETDEFRGDCDTLGLHVETDLMAIQAMIMLAPEGPPVIQGTGGLRKARFAPNYSKKGKSGAIRICYAYFKKHWIVLLVMAYSKNEKDNISKDERGH